MKTLGIIGGGQLGYMLCESVLKINKDIKINVYSDKEDIPCNLLKPDITIIYGKYENNENWKKFLNICDIITYEFESFDINLLKSVENKVYPKIDKLEIIQDKLKQKQYLEFNNLSVGPFKEIKTTNDIHEFIKKYNYPIMIKSRRGSFDGRGNKLIQNINELKNWLLNNKEIIQQYYLESFIKFQYEMSICGCLDKNKNLFHYDPVINKHKNNILLNTTYSKNIKLKLKFKIIKLYKQLLKLFDTKGVICVEFFIANDNVYVNEIALRVHNSYHISLDCCNLSQFEMYIRSIMGLKVMKPKFICNGIMYNIISNMQELNDILKIINNQVDRNCRFVIKDYHKKPNKIRKIGHINLKLSR